MDFLSMVRNKVHVWFGREVRPDLADGFDVQCWDELDRIYQDSFIAGLRQRVQDLHMTPEEWWANGGGERYSRTVISRYAHRLNALTETPTPEVLRSEYAELSRELKPVIKRIQPNMAPVLCDD